MFIFKYIFYILIGIVMASLFHEDASGKYQSLTLYMASLTLFEVLSTQREKEQE